MADNVTLDPGSGGATLAADDISGTHHQRVKIQYGEDGSATDVSDTDPLPIDDAGGSLTVDNADITTIAGAVSGTEMQVDVVAALPAGTNAIGKLAANSGVDIGDVDVLSLDGVAAEGGALGNGILIQGDDGTDRKNINVDATTGDVQVDVTNTVTVDGSAVTQPVSGTVTANLSATDNSVLDNIDTNTTGLAGCVSGSELQVDIVSGGTGSTQYAEDTVHNTGDTGTMTLAVRNDVLAALAGTDGDYAPFQVNASGALFVQEGAAMDVSAATVTVDGSAVTQPVSGTVTADLGATDNAVLDQLELNTSYGDNTGAGTEAGALRVTLPTDCTGVLSVDDNGGALTVDNAGVFAVQIDGSGLTALQLIDDAVFADDAAFTLTSSKVMMSGAIRDDTLGTLTAVEGDAVPLRVGSTGALHVTGGGGGTEYTVNAAVPTDPTGTASLMERDDALSSLTEIEGDWSNMRCDANGALWVIPSGTVTVDGSGVTQPVSGTVTADLGATDNAVLDQLEVNTSYGDNTGGGVELGSLRVTIANDSTGLVSVDDNGGSLTVDNADITTVAGAVSGSEMQVDVVAALPAGTNAIGKLAANTGVDIGDVDVTSVVPGTAATNLGKAEDAAHTTGDVGVMPLAVRNDDLAALAGTDGDYAPLQVTQNGALLMCPAANDDYKYASIDAASSGDNTLVAAVASRKIRVVSAFLVSAGTLTTRFEDGAAGTALTGQMNLVANSGFTLPFNPAGWFETSVNTLLNLELSAATSVDGCVTYIEVP